MKHDNKSKAVETMQKIMEDVKHPEYGESLQNTLRILRYDHQTLLLYMVELTHRHNGRLLSAIPPKSGNVEGYETVEKLRSQLPTKPSIDPEKGAEAADMDFVVADLLKKMSEVPKDMSGQ